MTATRYTVSQLTTLMELIETLSERADCYWPQTNGSGLIVASGGLTSDEFSIVREMRAVVAEARGVAIRRCAKCGSCDHDTGDLFGCPVAWAEYKASRKEGAQPPATEPTPPADA